MNDDDLASLKKHISEGWDLLRLRQRLVSSGGTREQIIACLRELRADFRRAGDERSEDVVLELLDFAVGWCAPHVRL
jgi:hypothetical protein